MSHPPSGLLPVTILTGFLGTGKTTLLNRLLSAPHGLRLGVIVNDFGAINIDARLVDVMEGDAMSLSNGCVCCSMRGSLVSTVLDMLRRVNPPEALLIEASGIADPASIAGAFQTSALRDRTHIEGIITMVDAENAQNPRLDSQLITEQIRTADLVVLNKIDLIDEATRRELITWICSVAPAARILPTIQADVPVELVLRVGRAWNASTHVFAGEDEDQADDPQYDHAALFGSWSYSTDRLLAYRKVRAALEHLPLEVFRAKGTLALADAPNLRFIAQMVGRRVSIEPDLPWQDEPPTTDLIFIGTPCALNPAEVVARFDACATDDLVLMSRQNFATAKRAATASRLALTASADVEPVYRTPRTYKPLTKNDRTSTNV